MKTRTVWIVVLGTLLILLGVVLINKPKTIDDPRVPPVSVPNTDEPQPPAPPIVKSEGQTSVKLLETAVFKDIKIMPTKVLEDSRCASDVQCVWAGQVKIETEVVGKKDAIAHQFIEGSVFSFEGYNITLAKVEPYPVSTKKITEGEYRFTFKVEKQKPVAAAKCYVGGCSSQICSDKPDVASTCIYREVYACYQGAACERQSDGQCGWTQTPALKACVAEKSAVQ